jgi:predicted nucleic acid-binding protein
MYLVDTSVWIDYLREVENIPCNHFATIIDQNIPFGLTGIIYQEVLQGAASEEDFQMLVNYLSTQRFYQFIDDISGHEGAAEIYFKCRRKGITIRNTIDCMIARIAIEHNLTLLHNDKDYLHIASVIPELKLFPEPPKIVSYQVHDRD